MFWSRLTAELTERGVNHPESRNPIIRTEQRQHLRQNKRRRHINTRALIQDTDYTQCAQLHSHWLQWQLCQRKIKLKSKISKTISIRRWSRLGAVDNLVFGQNNQLQEPLHQAINIQMSGVTWPHLQEGSGVTGGQEVGQDAVNQPLSTRVLLWWLKHRVTMNRPVTAADQNTTEQQLNTSSGRRQKLCFVYCKPGHETMKLRLLLLSDRRPCYLWSPHYRLYTLFSNITDSYITSCGLETDHSDSEPLLLHLQLPHPSFPTFPMTLKHETVYHQLNQGGKTETQCPDSRKYTHTHNTHTPPDVYYVKH